ncbi:MAG: transglutaminase family protein [Acidobacteria bacterium]|nr:transglutaminase family protein [Acidobacteriota bacterium]
MTKTEVRAQWAELLARPDEDWELDRAALLLAAEEYPLLQIEPYLSLLDSFASRARVRDDLFADPVTRIMRLNEVLFSEFGFRGNTDQYFDARNSFLNDVLDRRTGIPITLSVVYLEVARRIELPLVGVGLPGHFLVKYDDGAQEILLDPFHSGRLLTEDDCRAKIAEMYQGEMRFHKALLAAVSKRQILLRMLRNLKGIYAQAKDHAKTLSVIERLLLLAPEADTELRDRGLVHFGLQRYAEARADLEAYLRCAPQASDAKDIKDLLAKVRQRQAQLN